MSGSSCIVQEVQLIVITHYREGKVSFNVTDLTYNISYNANGGSGAPSSQTKYYDKLLSLSSLKPIRTGYTFKGWSTSSTATKASYQSGR